MRSSSRTVDPFLVTEDDAPLPPHGRGPLIPGDPHARAPAGSKVALRIDPAVLDYVARHNVSLERFVNEAALAAMAKG